MSGRIRAIEPGSVADLSGLRVGDDIISVNGHRIRDEIDLRFYGAERHLALDVRRNGILSRVDLEREPGQGIGLTIEEFAIRTCADDCIFCFVDQNPPGLREALYFRDSDPRMSFLYGNYVTVTNLRQADLERIVEQRLSPMYISVHCTDDEVRRRMMGHTRQDDRLMEKLVYLKEHDIEMHTQIVLVPGYNDGIVLEKTVSDLFEMGDAVQSVSVVPVGLTAHRRGLDRLRPVSRGEAAALLVKIQGWQDQYRSSRGRGFVYGSDELYILAGVDFPPEEAYDGFPLMENGVGMCRDFLSEFKYQSASLPEAIPESASVIMVTGRLAYDLLQTQVAPALNQIEGLEVTVVEATNTLFGEIVTVSGLLGFNCVREALAGIRGADLVLLPPDCVSFEGLFLDNKPGMMSPKELEEDIGMPVRIFTGDWLESLAPVLRRNEVSGYPA